MADNLKAGIIYPWNNASRLWNILWMLIPFLGALAIMGYVKEIVKSLATGNNKELPAFGNFWDNTLWGLKIIIFILPTAMVLGLIYVIPKIGALLYTLIALIMLPWLMINFYTKEKFSALWEIEKCFSSVTKNLGDYVVSLLKTIVYVIIYGLASFILIGIPCYTFGSMYYMAEFYKENH